MRIDLGGSSLTATGLMIFWKGKKADELEGELIGFQTEREAFGGLTRQQRKRPKVCLVCVPTASSSFNNSLERH